MRRLWREQRETYVLPVVIHGSKTSILSPTISSYTVFVVGRERVSQSQQKVPGRSEGACGVASKAVVRSCTLVLVALSDFVRIQSVSHSFRGAVRSLRSKSVVARAKRRMEREGKRDERREEEEQTIIMNGNKSQSFDTFDVAAGRG